MIPKYRVRADGKMQPVYALKRCSDGLHVLAGDEKSSVTYRPGEYDILDCEGLVSSKVSGEMNGKHYINPKNDR